MSERERIGPLSVEDEAEARRQAAVIDAALHQTAVPLLAAIGALVERHGPNGLPDSARWAVVIPGPEWNEFLSVWLAYRTATTSPTPPAPPTTNTGAIGSSSVVAPAPGVTLDFEAAEAAAERPDGYHHHINCAHLNAQAARLVAEAVQRERERWEGKHLPQGLFAEYTRLDIAWQKLVAERDEARRKLIDHAALVERVRAMVPMTLEELKYHGIEGGELVYRLHELEETLPEPQENDR